MSRWRITPGTPLARALRKSARQLEIRSGPASLDAWKNEFGDASYWKNFSIRQQIQQYSAYLESWKSLSA